jgi:acylphosphatase
MSATSAHGEVRAVALVSGRVQMVGYRFWTRSTALALGVAGSATNLPDGRVEVVAEGPPDRVEALLGRLGDGPPSARVDDVQVDWTSPTGVSGFAVS